MLLPKLSKVLTNLFVPLDSFSRVASTLHFGVHEMRSEKSDSLAQSFFLVLFFTFPQILSTSARKTFQSRQIVKFYSSIVKNIFVHPWNINLHYNMKNSCENGPNHSFDTLTGTATGNDFSTDPDFCN